MGFLRCRKRGGNIKGVKRFLFPGAVLFVLFIPQSAFALSATVTQGLKADPVSFEVTNESSLERYYDITSSEDWASVGLIGGHQGWLFPGASGTVKVNLPITRDWDVGAYSTEILVEHYEVVNNKYVRTGSFSVIVTMTVISPVIPRLRR